MEDMKGKKRELEAMQMIPGNLPGAREKVRNAVLSPPLAPWLPEALFVASLGSGADADACQRIWRLLSGRGRDLSKRLVAFDVEILWRAPGVTAIQVRAYYFFKYGLRNRGAVEVTEWDNVATALEGQESKTGERAKQKESLLSLSESGGRPQ